MPDPARRRFYEHFAAAMEDGDAALFVGAGLSVPAGFVNWKELLRDIAEDLGLRVDDESDLVALAQYHVNAERNRSRINRTLVGEFTRDARLTANHRLLASLPVRTVWTTNYDRLLERAYEAAGKRVDVKTDRAQLAHTVPKRDVTLYKMHGDVERPDQAVLIKDDYETYHRGRGDFVTLLNGDLLSKHFLFLGFSFTDPNVDQVLARVRAGHADGPREHYWVVRRPAPATEGDPADRARYDYECRKQALRVDDLRRYGIKPVLIDDYAEVEEILGTLARLHLRRSVFVSGSAADYAPLGRERLEGLARRLGARLIAEGYRLVSGFGLGVGGAVLVGAMERLHADERLRAEDRLLLRPFPQDIPDPARRATLWTGYREDMLAQARFAVFLAGNTRPASDGGAAVPARGVREEFEIARRLGVYPVPVGATGSVAAELWREVSADLPGHFPGIPAAAAAGLAPALDVLGTASSSDDALLDAIMAVIRGATGALAAAA